MNIILLGVALFVSLISSDAQYADTIYDYNSIIVDYDSGPLPNLPTAIISDPIPIPPVVPYQEKSPKESYKKRWPIKPSIPTFEHGSIEQIFSSTDHEKITKTVCTKKEDIETLMNQAIDHQELIETSVDNIRTDIEYWPEKRKPPKFVRDYKYRFGNGKGVGIGHRYKDGKYLGKGYVGLPQKETKEW